MPRKRLSLPLIIAGGVIALLALIMGIRFVALHFVSKRGESVIEKHYKPEEIVRKDTEANGRGLLSKGTDQVRGNGALVLTKKELAFFQISPDRELKIAVGDITSVDIVHDHNGYSGRPLLQVHFKVGDTTDAFAWYVRNWDDWKRDIDRIRTGS